MKKFTTLSAAFSLSLVAVCFAAFQNCSGPHENTLSLGSSNTTNSTDLASTLSGFEPQTTSSSVRYFGYFATAIGGDVNYMSEVSDHTNVALIHDSDQGLTNKLNAASDAGLRAVVSTSGLLISASDGKKTVDTQDYDSTWFESHIVNPIRASRGGVGNVTALYAFDEPYWNLCDANLNDCDLSAKKNVLEAEIRTMRRFFPTTPIAVVFSVPEVILMSQGRLQIPQGLNWVGVDCYGSDLANGMGTGGPSFPSFMDRCGSPGYGVNSMAWYHEVLLRNMSADQSLVGVPQGVLGVDHGSDQEQRALVSEIDRYMAMVNANPRFIALFPFIWQFLGASASSSDNFGVRDLARLRAKYRAIGNSITGRIASREPASAPAVGLYTGHSLCKDAEYVALYPDVKASGRNPRWHFKRHGRAEGRCEPAIAECSFPITAEEYLELYDDVARSGFASSNYGAQGAWVHYMETGKNEGRCLVDNVFDARQYILANPDLIRTLGVIGGDPSRDQLESAKQHYCRQVVRGGEARALIPGGRAYTFSPEAYLNANADVRSSGVNARDHFCQNGVNENRVIN